MMPEKRMLWRIGIVTLASSLVAASSSKPPNSRLNLLTTLIETTDAEWTSTDYEIRHVIDPGDGQPLIVVRLTNDPHDDLSPELALDGTSGDTWVAWWRDASPAQVLVRKRNNTSGAWSSERLLSTSTESSRDPSVVFDGSRAWVAYQFDASGGGSAVAAKVIEDDPAPFVQRTLVGTTAASGDRDVLLQYASGRLWVSWIHSATVVGWAKYSYSSATWTAPAFESYPDGSVAAARTRIRAAVLAN